MYIPEIPTMPEEIVEAVNKKELVVFIGAGVSRLLGCKSWQQLSNALVEECYKTERDTGARCINFKERQKLLSESDPKKTITICKGILEQVGHAELYKKVLADCLKPDPKKLKGSQVYENLLYLSGTYVTTNADSCFHEHFVDEKS